MSILIDWFCSYTPTIGDRQARQRNIIEERLAKIEAKLAELDARTNFARRTDK